ncbi:MAG: hypothetical protein IPM37_07750 [Hahellaceae bacterium]|nr:hypothetical protein [Hahellaceae bacterium]
MSVSEVRQHFVKQAEKQIGHSVPLLVIGENTVVLKANDQTWRVCFNQDEDGNRLVPLGSTHERLDLLATAVEACLYRLETQCPESMYILINNHLDLTSAAFCHAFLTQVAEVFRLYVSQSDEQALHVIFTEKTLDENDVLRWIRNEVVASRMRSMLSHFDELESQVVEQSRLLPEFDIRKTA